jgi:mono/diheme cytochrome c family protein
MPAELAKRRPRPAAGWLVAYVLGGLSALAAAALGGLLYIAVGGFNVSATRPHNALTQWVTKTMMVHSVKLRARGVAAPRAFDQAQVLAGFRIYEARCVGCHGAPGVAPGEAWSAGLTPVPPTLVGAPREFTPAELYWIIKNGVKLTGMPAWDRECSEPELWRLVAFLEALPRLPSTAYRDLRATAAPDPQACGGVARPAR